MRRRSAVAAPSIFVGAAYCIAALVPATARAEDPPTIELVMKFVPQQTDVDFELVDPKNYKQCKINIIKEGKTSGYVVTGPNGQVLRRFMDTDGNGKVDQFSYYKNGLEVYRDIDSDGNAKVDQSRWLNRGGMRWGFISKEDGRIDSWKMISAQEVSRIAVRALVSQDASLLVPLLVSKDDLKELGIAGPLEKKLLDAVAEPAAKLRNNVRGSKLINAKTVWQQFDASPPGAVPADACKTPADLQVYENVMAIVVDSSAPKEKQQPGLVNIGELVRVGDVWKLTMVPYPLEGQQSLAEGAIISFGRDGEGAAAPDASPPSSQKVQELVKKYNDLIKTPPQAAAGKAGFEDYYKKLELVLREIIQEAGTREEWTQWTRQLLDVLAAAAQSGNYPKGVDQLKKLEGELAAAAPSSPLIAAAHYRRMLSTYVVEMQDAKANKDKLQERHTTWLEELEKFLDDHPKADDAPDAAMQLAVGSEFAGKVDKAKKWYRLASEYRDSPGAVKAAGALQRLQLEGKSLALAGPSLTGAGAVDLKQLRGKIVLVVFWDTTSVVSEQELPQIKALYEEYKKGFEVVGVNIDADKATVRPFLTRHQIAWPQIYEPGGMDAPLAKSFGIMSLPTMFLVDATGKVVKYNASVADAKNLLEETYKKK
jgi:thiol-disulfide isomerase/thioredoxin